MPHHRPRRAIRAPHRFSSARRVRRLAAAVPAVALSLASVYGLTQATSASARTEPLSHSQPLAAAASPEVSGEQLAAEQGAASQRLAAAESVTRSELLTRQAALDETSRAAEAESQRLLELGKFYYPTIGEIGSKWGMRLHPIQRVWKMHAGIDVGSPCDAPVWAVLDGTVVAADFGAESGNYVRIDHGVVDGRHLVTTSMHMNKIEVAAGQVVTRGQQLGLSGSTGLSTGCHVHLSLWVDGVNSDPMPYLKI